MNVKFDLSFGWVLVLAFITLVLLGWAVAHLQRQFSSSNNSPFLPGGRGSYFMSAPAGVIT